MSPSYIFSWKIVNYVLIDYVILVLAVAYFLPRYFPLYSTLNKITQFWLVESSTINPKLYSVRVPIKSPWKRRVRKKLADSRFAILMALFLPNKELFTNFVMFNHAWKHEEDRWNYFQCHTKLNLRVATILAWFWWLCYHVNWKITSFSYSS